MRYFKQEQSSNFVHAQVYFLSFDFFFAKRKTNSPIDHQKCKGRKNEPTFSLKSGIKNSDFPFGHLELNFGLFFLPPPPSHQRNFNCKILFTSSDCYKNGMRTN